MALLDLLVRTTEILKEIWAHCKGFEAVLRYCGSPARDKEPIKITRVYARKVEC
jgi:hypothetical protein